VGEDEEGLPLALLGCVCRDCDRQRKSLVSLEFVYLVMWFNIIKSNLICLVLLITTSLFDIAPPRAKGYWTAEKVCFMSCILISEMCLISQSGYPFPTQSTMYIPERRSQPLPITPQTSPEQSSYSTKAEYSTPPQTPQTPSPTPP
jgi:hypothetical protein